MPTFDDSRVVLQVRIQNESPIAVEDLAASLHALGDEYREWLSDSAERSVTDDVQLYVRELRSGSIIADLVALTPLALPFLENANSIIDFANHLWNGFDFLLGRLRSAPDLPQHSYQNLCTIVEPVAKDGASQLNVSTIINGDVHNHFHLNSIEANAAQNTARRRIKEVKTPVTGFHDRVVMSLHQARNDAKSSAGDRAIIESLHGRPIKLIFATEALKRRLLSSSENPFQSAYVIDVQVETVDGRPALYKVLDIHDTIARPGAENAA